MESSPSAPNDLAKLLLSIATDLPPDTHVLVLRDLPLPQLARLACVHKAYRVAWWSLQQQHPGNRYAPPSATDIELFKHYCLLECAGRFGDVAVIQSMVEAGVDERVEPLLRARAKGLGVRVVDNALKLAASYGHVQAVMLLLQRGANVHADGDYALRWASHNGHAAVVQLLIQRGANVHAGHDLALRHASKNGHAAVVKLLIHHGAHVHALDDRALRVASEKGRVEVVQVLIQHGADVHARNDWALQHASKSGRMDVVQVLVQHGADVHARDNRALQVASRWCHMDVAQLLIQHGAHMP
jgi:ankyrin repeat protein